ncbi:MAG TPA: hypothetical protein PLL98_09040 [Bacillota bacterium]|nr:hypothetical protein [Bacillota bacterium]HPL54515.1 hypothetical protein [Bacillota bacterium]
MQCKEINRLIMKYFDGNISELEKEMIIKHNDRCSCCAEEFTLLKEAIDSLSELPEIEVPTGFVLRVMEGIRTREKYSANPKAAAFWLVSIFGLIVFGWNIFVFSVIPFVKESGTLIAVNNVLIYGFNIISSVLREVLITVSVLLGKILILRNVLLRDYVTAVTLIVLAFTGINLFLINSRRLQEN